MLLKCERTRVSESMRDVFDRIASAKDDELRLIYPRTVQNHLSETRSLRELIEGSCKLLRPTLQK